MGILMGINLVEGGAPREILKNKPPSKQILLLKMEFLVFETQNQKVVAYRFRMKNCYSKVV